MKVEFNTNTERVTLYTEGITEVRFKTRFLGHAVVIIKDGKKQQFNADFWSDADSIYKKISEAMEEDKQ